MSRGPSNTQNPGDQTLGIIIFFIQFMHFSSYSFNPEKKASLRAPSVVSYTLLIR